MNKKTITIISISILILVLIAVGVLFFTKVVNANRLSCTSNNSSGSVKIEQKYIINYDKDKVTNATITKRFEYTDQKQFDAFKSVVIPGNDASMKKLENSNISFSSKTSGMAYSTTTTANVTAAKTASVTELGLNKSLKTLKSNLESQGLVCK